MQPVGRNGAVEQMVRRARPAAARIALGIGQRAHGLVLEPRRHPVGRHRNPGCEGPRIDGKRLGGGAGRGASRAHAHGAGKGSAVRQQRAAIEKAVAGHAFDGIRTFAMFGCCHVSLPSETLVSGTHRSRSRCRQCCAIMAAVSRTAPAHIEVGHRRARHSGDGLARCRRYPSAVAAGRWRGPRHASPRPRRRWPTAFPGW